MLNQKPRARSHRALGLQRRRFGGLHRHVGRRRAGRLGTVMAVQVLAVGLAVQRLRFLRRLVFGLVLGGLLLGLGDLLGLLLQPQALSPRFGALLLALLLAGSAFAADRLQIGLEVVGAVIVVDLLARLDVLDGADEDLALARLDVGFRVRPAGVVDVAGDVFADRTVDGPAAVELEQIFVLDRVLVLFPGIQDRSEITDDLGTLLDRLGGEEAEASLGSTDAVGFVRRNGSHGGRKLAL